VQHAIVGRRGELEAIGAFVAGVSSGACGLLLQGEPGIGKTRLWVEGIEHARERDWVVLSSRPGEAEARLAFAGLTDLLEPRFRIVAPDLPSLQRRALETAFLLADAEERPVEGRMVSAAFLGALRLLAARQVVVLAVDDVQWLDVESVRVLEFALRRLDAEPVGLLATLRVAPHVSDAGELRRAVGEDRLTVLDLGPLSVGALHELIRSRLGAVLSRPTLLRIHETSGGNPFFALELARALLRLDREPTPAEPLPVPRELQALLRQRIGSLSAHARDVLLVAAALSHPSRSTIDAAAEDADVALTEAFDAGVIELDATRVRFVHPLLASTAYAEASPRQRRNVHSRLSEVVNDPEERARHRALAADGPGERVAHTLANAAEHAARRGAIGAAAELASLAVGRTPVVRRRSLHRRRLRAARYAVASGATERANSLLEAALEAARPGTERAEALCEQGDMRAETQDLRVALELYRAAAAEPVEELAVRASVAERIARLTGYWGGGYASAREHARDALELAEASGDPGLLVRALTTAGEIELWAGRPVPHAHMQRAEALEARSGSVDLEGPTFVYAVMLIDEGDDDGARRRLERLCVLGRESGDVAVSRAMLMLAALEWDAGRWELARNLCLDGQELAAQAAWDVVEAAALFILATFEAACGEVDLGRRLAIEALEWTERTGRLSRGPRGALALLELSVEHYEDAWDWVRPALERNRERQVLRPTELDTDAAEALAGLGRVDDARALLEPYVRRSERLHRNRAVAAAARAAGLVAAADGDLEGAVAVCRQAVEVGEPLQRPFELGRSLLALGSVERRLRHKRAARQTLERASSIFDDLGAPIWAERARVELGRIGGRSSRSGELTATENEIVELVVSGRSNKQVAQLLHVSPKTVEWNLSKIYRKLGVHSRTELSARR
jgi:DNA-binding CsgD family transcriptional regulator